MAAEQPEEQPAAQPAARRSAIAALVADRGFVRVTDLATEIGVSEVTVRSDLSALEAGGQIARVHGGAMPRAATVEPSFEQAISRDAATKRAIGEAAAALVESGMSVILDVGSTSLAVAEALVARATNPKTTPALTDVVVITNGLSIALALEPAMPRVTVVVTGGTLRPLQHSLVNPGASSSLEALHADLAFIGCNGVDAVHGVTNINLPEAEVKRQMLRSAARSIVLADASKLGQRHLGSVAPAASFALLITAGAVQKGVLRALEKRGLPALVAG
jgi:DeoR family transcriptional regulator, aga operon transcriptional repressor